MSLSGSLSNALSGLTAASRAAELVSSNLSNAMTEGYGRRSLDIAPRTIGAAGGVQVLGITRHTDPIVLGDRRLADADVQHSETVDKFQSKLATLVGSPEDDMSLSARLADLEQSLIVAASRPDSNERLKMVSRRADEVARALNNSSDGIQKLRAEADRAIDADVGKVNLLLGQARDLNFQIFQVRNSGKDFAALQDHRQLVVDQISEIVPVREMPRDSSGIALFTTGGAILLDGTAATLEFTPTNLILPHMTEASGLLSGLTINGITVRTDSISSPIRGGRLGANFQIRDETAVTAQTQVDAIARDLIERFQDPTVDPSLGASDPGLFTDVNQTFAPANQVGISGRVSLNSLVNPDTGDLWRLRDGLGAAASGDVGNASLLNSLQAALNEARAPASGSFGPASRSVSGLVAQFATQVSNDRQLSDQALAFATTRLTSLTVMELENGVDSDHELQRMILIEQSYAANARIIQAVDEMMKQLLRL